MDGEDIVRLGSVRGEEVVEGLRRIISPYGWLNSSSLTMVSAIINQHACDKDYPFRTISPFLARRFVSDKLSPCSVRVSYVYNSWVKVYF